MICAHCSAQVYESSIDFILQFPRSGNVLIIFPAHYPRYFHPLHDFLEHPEVLELIIPKIWQVLPTYHPVNEFERSSQTICFYMTRPSILVCNHSAVGCFPMSGWIAQRFRDQRVCCNAAHLHGSPFARAYRTHSDEMRNECHYTLN